MCLRDVKDVPGGGVGEVLERCCRGVAEVLERCLRRKKTRFGVAC